MDEEIQKYANTDKNPVRNILCGQFQGRNACWKVQNCV